MHTYFPVSTFFFFNDTATTEIYTLSLHDALPIFPFPARRTLIHLRVHEALVGDDLAILTVERDLDPVVHHHPPPDRKSTRLNSSHANISYAVFCLKKKKQHEYKFTLLTHTKIQYH